MTWNEKMQMRQKELRKAYLANRTLTPGVKAHFTKTTRDEIWAKNDLAAEAIQDRFDTWTQNELSPAIKAHFTMGTYDKYLAVF